MLPQIIAQSHRVIAKNASTMRPMTSITASPLFGAKLA
jgi:hypothetical protein